MTEIPLPPGTDGTPPKVPAAPAPPEPGSAVPGNPEPSDGLPGELAGLGGDLAGHSATAPQRGHRTGLVIGIVAALFVLAGVGIGVGVALRGSAAGSISLPGRLLGVPK